MTMRDTALTILKEEGSSAFFKGSLVAAISQLPNNFLVFGGWGLGRRLCTSFDLAGRLGVHHDAELREAIHFFAAGSFSGAVQSFALGPFEHIKIQQQVYGSRQHAKARLGLFDATRAVLRLGGLPLLFRGTGATLLRDAPVYGAYFLSYEYLKQYFALAVGPDPTHQLQRGIILTNDTVPVPAWSMLAAGATAGVLSWLLALPVDVIKSQVQSAPLDAPASDTRIAHVAARLYKQGGIPIFFRGLVPCLVRAAPVNAVTFLGFEWAHAILSSHLA